MKQRWLIWHRFMLSAKSFNTFFYPNKWFTQCNSVTGLKLTKNKDTEDEQADYEKQLHGNEHLNIAILTNWQQKSFDVVGSPKPKPISRYFRQACFCIHSKIWWAPHHNQTFTDTNICLFNVHIILILSISCICRFRFCSALLSKADFC